MQDEEDLIIFEKGFVAFFNSSRRRKVSSRLSSLACLRNGFYSRYSKRHKNSLMLFIRSRIRMILIGIRAGSSRKDEVLQFRLRHIDF